MADRLVEEWTATAEQAFGQTGQKGATGERWLASCLRGKGWEVIEYENDRDKQVAGIDLELGGPWLGRPITVDVKNNLTSWGDFWIETGPKGWLLNPAKLSDVIWHVNTETRYTVKYRRSDALKNIHVLRPRSHKGLAKFNYTDLPSFMRKSIL